MGLPPLLSNIPASPHIVVSLLRCHGLGDAPAVADARWFIHLAANLHNASA
jgi:hypothetical protein